MLARVELSFSWFKTLRFMQKKTDKKRDYQTKEECSRTRDRLSNGCAWMMCSDCGAKLYDFDGEKDSSRPCPYNSGGRCDPR